MKEHDGQFAAGQFLLEALNQPEDEKFEPYYEELSDKKISLLVSRQRPVPDGIKQASHGPELAAVSIDYYEDKMMKGLNPFCKDDVLNELVEVIREDKVIGDKKCEELLALYNEGKEGRFLGEVFLYVVNRPNKPDGDFVGFEDAPLIAEADYVCRFAIRSWLIQLRTNLSSVTSSLIYFRKDCPRIERKSLRQFIRNRRISR